MGLFCRVMHADPLTYKSCFPLSQADTRNQLLYYTKSYMHHLLTYLTFLLNKMQFYQKCCHEERLQKYLEEDSPAHSVVISWFSSSYVNFMIVIYHPGIHSIYRLLYCKSFTDHLNTPYNHYISPKVIYVFCTVQLKMRKLRLRDFLSLQTLRTHTWSYLFHMKFSSALPFTCKNLNCR